MNADADTDKDSAVDSGISSTPESRNATPNGTGKGFNVPEIEIQEYKVHDLSRSIQTSSSLGVQWNLPIVVTHGP